MPITTPAIVSVLHVLRLVTLPVAMDDPFSLSSDKRVVMQLAQEKSCDPQTILSSVPNMEYLSLMMDVTFGDISKRAYFRGLCTRTEFAQVYIYDQDNVLPEREWSVAVSLGHHLLGSEASHEDCFHRGMDVYDRWVKLFEPPSMLDVVIMLWIAGDNTFAGAIVQHWWNVWH